MMTDATHFHAFGKRFRHLRVALVFCGSLVSMFAVPGVAFGKAEAADEAKSAQAQSVPANSEWRTYAERTRPNAKRSRGVRRLPELPVRKPAEIRPAGEKASAEEADSTVKAQASGAEKQEQQTVSPTLVEAPAAETPADSDLVFLPDATKPLVGPHDVITTQAEEAKPQNTETEQSVQKENTDPDNPLLNPEPSRTPPQDRGEEYCSNIADAATDARFAWQKQILEETEQELQKRITVLETRIADYKQWVQRRDEFVKKAKQSITDIYAKMKPDAAAQQLMVLDEETAAAVLMTLNPRISSAVMAEMDPPKAARLTTIISLSAKGPKEPAAPPPAERQGT